MGDMTNYDTDKNGVLKRKQIDADKSTITNIVVTNQTVNDLFITVTGSSVVRVTGALAASPGTTLVAVVAGSDIINSVIKCTVGGTVCYLYGFRGTPTGMGM